MPNFRLVNKNLADLGTTTVSSQASVSLGVANLRTKSKSQVWRSAAGTTQRLTQTWTTPQLIGLAALPHSNLSATTLARLRLTNEPVATNLMLQASVQSNVAYTKTALTTGALGTAPDGAATAVSLADTAVSSVHMISQTLALLATTTYTFSLFIKANGRTRVALQNATLGALANFNLTTGAMLTTGGTGFVAGSIVAFPNSWFRVTLTFTTTGASSQSLSLVLQDASGNSTYLGTGVGVLSWGWQLETGATATSHYPTTTAALTRPLGHIDTWQAYTTDTGFVSFCPGVAMVPDGWTAAAAASAYAYGGGICGRIWLATQVLAYGAALDIVDTSNLQGYLEAPRWVLGTYWEAATNADYGASAEAPDRSKSSYDDAGNLITERGTRSTRLTVDMSKLGPTDRAYVWKTFRTSGTSGEIFASLYPNDPDGQLEQMHQIWGQFVSTPSMKTPFFKLATATLDLQGI